MGWIFVIGDRAAAEWVLKHERMGFRDNQRAHQVKEGDDFVVYITRGAFKNPTRDEAQLVAVGSVISPVQRRRARIGEEEFPLTCRVRIDTQVPLRRGLAFAPLVGRLRFIKKKQSWAAYLRRSPVAIPATDLAVLSAAVHGHSLEFEGDRG